MVIWCYYCRQSGHIRARCPRLQHCPQFSTTASSPTLAAQIARLREQMQVMQRAHPTFSAMSAASGMPSASWILDSSATHHMTSDATHLVDLSPVHSSVRTADGTSLPVTQCGHLTPTIHSSVALPTVHHVPGLALNLVSVSQLTDHGLTVTFTSSCCFVQDHHIGQRVGTGRQVGGLYHLEHLRFPISATSTSASTSISDTAASACSPNR